MSAAASVATAEGRAGEPRLRDWLLDAALPMPSTAITELVPTIMPSIVSSERVRLRKIASSASPA